MKSYIYIIEYRYTKRTSVRYKCFDNLEDAYDYYIFLKNNLILHELKLKKCSLKCEVFLCGR